MTRSYAADDYDYDDKDDDYDPRSISDETDVFGQVNHFSQAAMGLLRYLYDHEIPYSPYYAISKLSTPGA